MNPPIRQNRSRRSNRASGMTIASILFIIMALSIAAGYGATKYFIYPYLLNQGLTEAKNTPTSGGVIVDNNEVPNGNNTTINNTTSETTNPVVSEQIDTKETEPTPTVDTEKTPSSGTGTGGITTYCLQFGNLSDQGAATALVNKLKAAGISSRIAEVNGQFKVVGSSHPNKDSARAAIAPVKPIVPDVFVTVEP